MGSYPILENRVVSEAGLSELMHRNSAHENTPFMSMLRKDDASQQRVMNEYLTHWEKDGNDAEDIDEARKKRGSHYMSIVNKYVLFSMYSPPFLSHFRRTIHAILAYSSAVTTTS